LSEGGGDDFETVARGCGRVGRRVLFDEAGFGDVGASRAVAAFLGAFRQMSKSKSISDTGAIFSRNIDWNLFKIFCQIGDRGGIGAAGRALNKQQPSISAALKRLEDHVGVPLCVRTSKGVTLTAFGQRLFSVCEEMTSSIQNIPYAASIAKEGLSGVVTLSVISNLHLVSKLNAVFSEFHQRHPKIEIKLDVAPWRRVLQSLEAGEAELGIGFDDEEDGHLTKVPVIDQVQQLYCGPGHGLFGRTITEPQQLRDEPFVVTSNEPLQYGQYRKRYGLGHQVGGIADNLQERMWLIQLGVGIGFLPKPIVGASTFAKVLWPLLAKDAAPVCTLYFMSAANKAKGGPAQLLWETALRHLQKDRMRSSRDDKSAIHGGRAAALSAS
jgi:DNA-binding transcriptional LysR family regulator